MKKILNAILSGMFYLWLFVGSAAIGTEIPMRLEERKKKELIYIDADLEQEFLRPEWLNERWFSYYQNVEIYVNEEPRPDGGVCYINGFGEIYFNFEHEHYWEALLRGKSCIAHEVGHQIDKELGYPSETEEFQEAVDLAAQIDWGIASWPGILGNESVGEAEWGGYGELYADLFERTSIGDIPAVLWDWYLPFYE